MVAIAGFNSFHFILSLNINKMPGKLPKLLMLFIVNYF